VVDAGPIQQEQEGHPDLGDAHQVGDPQKCADHHDQPQQYQQADARRQWCRGGGGRLMALHSIVHVLAYLK